MEKQMLKYIIKIVKNAYKKIDKIDKKVLDNDSKEFVTNCDFIIEEYLTKKLTKKYRDIGILGEESNGNIKNCNKYFTIDPIDGTINFANDIDIWGIQIAYIENNVAIISVVYFPKLNKLFYSIKGEGAYVNNKKVSIKKYTTLGNSLIALNTKSNSKQFELCNTICDKIMKIRLLGCPSYGFSLVASGSLDGYCIIGNKPWDIEPGLLLCKEANAKIYIDDFCTIVANDNKVIDVLLESIKKTY